MRGEAADHDIKSIEQELVLGQTARIEISRYLPAPPPDWPSRTPVGHCRPPDGDHPSKSRVTWNTRPGRASCDHRRRLCM